MIIDHNTSKFFIFRDDLMSQALHKISDNKSGVVFVLESDGTLAGIITDGDFRRWLLNVGTLDLAQIAAVAMNTNFTSMPNDAEPATIASKFSDKIQYIPLVDSQKRFVGIAWPDRVDLKIGDFTIADDQPSFIIAEIGNNHNGSLQLAKELIDAAVNAGADCAKFQMRDMETMYRNSGHAGSSEDLGAEYTLDLLARFQLSNDELFQAFDHCKKMNILPLCTPFDESSLNALECYGMVGYKVASADLTNSRLLQAIAKTHKPIFCSTGMSSDSDIRQAVDILHRNAAQFALLHCNSTYPAPFKDINLKYIESLKALGNGCPVGYSGHERGFAVPIAAVAMGARVIEKHFTMDRTMEGNDHRVSLLPDEFADMVRSIRHVEASLGSAEPRFMTQGELMNREVLGKSILAATDIKAGHIIEEHDLDIRSPGQGLQPNRMSELVGTAARRDLSAGDFFFPSDVEEYLATARDFNFGRPFGVPVRYHDAGNMQSMSNFDLLEFHLSYKDLEINPSDVLLDSGYNMDFAVHCPELFANDHVLDLCADDPNYRARSIRELQNVVEVTRSLKRFFKKSNRPVIIVNAGGFTMNDFMPANERADKYKLIASALSQIDTIGVEITFQTMPPFPWHFGGQRFHNLFMDPDEIVTFCSTHNMRVTLDISHSKLYCNLKHISFAQFLDKVAPYAAHLHVVDARGTDGEGLQIGDGDIDFVMCGQKFLELCPNASFIPEVWQGHKNDGEGFWLALERLERAFGADLAMGGHGIQVTPSPRHTFPNE